jgi:hypothetical protein
VTFREDHSQVRTCYGLTNLAALCTLAINALSLNGHTNIAAGLREHARTPVLPLLTLGLHDDLASALGRAARTGGGPVLLRADWAYYAHDVIAAARRPRELVPRPCSGTGAMPSGTFGRPAGRITASRRRIILPKGSAMEPPAPCRMAIDHIAHSGTPNA